ncbi:MAG: hypothetical protein Q9166_002845 [cf. Caloplaca sp. 2 TL-2023]
MCSGTEANGSPKLTATLKESEEELPELTTIIQQSLPKHVVPKSLKTVSAQLTGALPQTPPITPSTPRYFDSSSSSASPKTPIRGIRPTRGMQPTLLATPPHSLKRVRFGESKIEASTPVKRLRLNSLNSNTETLRLTPNNSIRSSNTVSLSSLEASRVIKSVMRQVNWDEVVYHVATNQKARYYKRAIQHVFDNWKEKLAASEDSDE